MPGRGRGGGRRRRVLNFLQPCILVLLHKAPAHGYRLINDLEKFGFNPEKLDPSLIYRALRELEGGLLVSSEWADESLGPQKRVYQITSAGETALTEWIEDLRRTKQEIDVLLETYRDSNPIKPDGA